MNNPWFYLIIASVFEVLWMLSLKYMNMTAIKSIEWNSFFLSSNGICTLLPLILYAVFGLANVYLISLAMKEIPMSIAFSVWFGMALVGSSLIDTFWFKTGMTPIGYLFMLMIVFGVIGLKYSTK